MRLTDSLAQVNRIFGPLQIRDMPGLTTFNVNRLTSNEMPGLLAQELRCLTPAPQYQSLPPSHEAMVGKRARGGRGENRNERFNPVIPDLCLSLRALRAPREAVFSALWRKGRGVSRPFVPLAAGLTQAAKDAKKDKKTGLNPDFMVFLCELCGFSE